MSICIGDFMPAAVHAAPDQSAIALCRDLFPDSHAECVILYGSRTVSGWDQLSHTGCTRRNRGGYTATQDQLAWFRPSPRDILERIWKEFAGNLCDIWRTHKPGPS